VIKNHKNNVPPFESNYVYLYNFKQYVFFMFYIISLA